MVISVASSGVFIGGKTGSSTFIPNPTIAHIPIATLSGNIISAAPEASSIIVGSKTAFLNGPPVTVGGSVFKFIPTGVVVADTDGKSSSTFAVPTFLPSSPGQSEFVVNGIHVSVSAGASTIVIGHQTITYGGPLITLSNHDVLSLGPSGLIIQMPSGRVSTVTMAVSTTARAASKGIGSIIASSRSPNLSIVDHTNSFELSVGGLGNSTTPAPSTTSTQSSEAQVSSTTSVSIAIPTGSGGRVDIRNGLVWMAGCYLMGLVP
jgi:hypothetical protein